MAGESEESLLFGVEDGLRAIAQVQLGQQRRDVQLPAHGVSSV
jgi:hypothetical protein